MILGKMYFVFLMMKYDEKFLVPVRFYNGGVCQSLAGINLKKKKFAAKPLHPIMTL